MKKKKEKGDKEEGRKEGDERMKRTETEKKV